MAADYALLATNLREFYDFADRVVLLVGAGPFSTLLRARVLAPDIAVYDHSPDSEWIFCTTEEEIVRRSALKNFGIRHCALPFSCPAK